MLSFRIITIHYSRPRLSLFPCFSCSVFVSSFSHFSALSTLFNKRNKKNGTSSSSAYAANCTITWHNSEISSPRLY